ncbi:BUD22-domain-containing protein [Mycena vitilis]|nr:BUD22-domain-containing protein [Mycena vitilis]
MDSTPSTTAPRGTKRKRPAPPAEDPATKLAGKLHHELKEVRKAAKKARTFETQRVVKKLKGVRKKDPAASEIAVLEVELEELKTIDSDAIADTALRTRLLKDRHIAISEPARAAMARELPSPTTPPLPNTTSKVHTRLLSARALGAAVSQAVAGLRAVLLPPVAAGAVDMDVDAGEDEEEEEGNEGAEEEGDAAGWESGSVDGDGGDDSEEDGDEDEDGWESGSVHSDAPPPAKKSTTTKAAKAVPVPAPVKAKAKEAPASASQFLPSLAVGFVRGGSDSDFDEDADGVEEEGPKKNRRGQRARRAIWEKKYGRGANHKKKEAEEVAKERAEQKAQFEARQAKRAAAVAAGGSTSRPGHARGGKWSEGAQVADRGWGARGTAQTQTQAHPQTQTQTQTGPPQQRNGTGASGGYGGARGQAKPEAGLHPSWAAKKAMKEKMGSGIVPSQGTKIVFT